jgi:hypothetical protein
VVAAAGVEVADVDDDKFAAAKAALVEANIDPNARLGTTELVLVVGWVVVVCGIQDVAA